MKAPFKRLIIPVISFALVIATLIAGIVFRSRIPDCGLADVGKASDIPEGLVKLSYAWGARDEEWMESESFAIGENGTYGVLDEPIVARVGFTGNVRIANGSLGQEITVKEVLRGEKFLSEGQTCYCYQKYGFRAEGEGVEFLGTLNMMNPNYDYLIFLEESPLNAYAKEQAYLVNSVDFGYIKIGGEETKTLNQDYRSYDFMELGEYEFFSDSKRCTAVLNKIQGEILAEFGY